MMLPIDMAVLVGSFLACSSFPLIIKMAGSIGTDVKSAFSPYELMHSPCWSFMFFVLCPRCSGHGVVTD